MKNPSHTHRGHPKPHHSDHSGAHAVGTAHHMKNAANPLDGQEGPSSGGGMAGGVPPDPGAGGPMDQAAGPPGADMGGGAPGGAMGGPPG